MALFRDNVIKALGSLLIAVAREYGAHDFVGHIGGDDFVVLAPVEVAAPLGGVAREAVEAGGEAGAS